MISNRRGPVAALLALAVTLPLVQTAVAAPAAESAPAAREAAVRQVELPRPTGPHTVGVSTLQLTESGRPDPWVPESGARQSMVTLHYPAAAGTGGGPRQYLTPDEARALVAHVGPDRLPAGSEKPLSETRSWARQDARPVKGKFPLVVLSPGFGGPRVSLTHLAEDLASRGYVVASVDHAYESAATTFPGRGMLPCVACVKTENGEVPYSDVSRGRAKDVSYLISRLTGPRSVWKHSAAIDARKIGMAGHSIGGASAAHTMATDSRVDAGVNMDGSFFIPIPDGGLDGRPFLLLGAGDSRPGTGDGSWDAAWRKLAGWKRWLTVTGSEHDTFSDLPVLSEQLGAPGLPGLTGDRAAGINRVYLAAFLDRHLKGASRPVLNGPTAANPEVVFHAP
ncbi:alpha/beta hydrolase family protein [Streptomyces qinzhouensis]|uniref:Alpha/beta hydrolase n=1 Tax=Streptomyces qinzhouensis TaxID=2599401 RepID=A0A5B8J5B6_9ACTN|nr:alpha/beta hydrolase [Streptomyces qinzhouensis]QDY75574.1 alpha/beta hydrolase [Streptomyces qinzhouensis]